MGIALGVVGYFFYRKYLAHCEYRLLINRLTPEELARQRQMEAEIERNRQNGSYLFLRVGMIFLGLALGAFVATLFSPALKQIGFADDPAYLFPILGGGVGPCMLVSFVIEICLKRKVCRNQSLQQSDTSGHAEV